MHILIVKHDALGDVVRTSYFAHPLKDKFGAELRLSWITSPAAVPVLRFNPAIDDIWTTFDDAKAITFDKVYSLDDERRILEDVSRLRARALTGAYLDPGLKAAYTDDAAEWFDMGLLSRHGKARADELKKRNPHGHAEIFARIFDVARGVARIHGDPALEAWANDWVGGVHPAVGLNPFAGGRWPSKQLPMAELRQLITMLLDGQSPLGPGCQLILLGAGADRQKNLALTADFSTKRLRVADTEDSVLRLAALIKSLDYLITSDSLPMHLALAQGVRTLAFFAPTSAAEIDDFGLLTKLASLSPDYCSYRAHADNRDITAARIVSALPGSPSAIESDGKRSRYLAEPHGRQF